MFSLNEYKRLIDELLESGFVPSTDWLGPMSSKTLLVRHDIDFSVDLAHRLALVEVDIGIRSTYFFMLTSNMYNLISSENRKFVQNIIKVGHKVSVHFDPTSHEDLDRFVVEKNLFESFFDVEVDIVSIHRPGPFLKNNNLLLNGVPQTYHDKYFRDMAYFSDSGGRNLKPLVSEYLKSDQGKGLQLLVHPIWWVRKGVDPTETLNAWTRQHLEFIKSEVRLNCKTYEG